MTKETYTPGEKTTHKNNKNAKEGWREEYNTKFEANKGQWSDPVKQKAASEKGLATMKRRREARNMISNGSKDLLYDAAAAVISKDQAWLEKILKMYLDIAQDESADPKTRMQAADQVTQIMGTRAPKSQEVVVEKKPDITEVMQELQSLGAIITSDYKIIEEDKDEHS